MFVWGITAAAIVATAILMGTLLIKVPEDPKD